MSDNEKKEIDLMDSDFNVIHPWDYPISNNLKVIKGR
jgi:hypothetical protein